MLASLKKIIPEQVKIRYHFLQAYIAAIFFRFPSKKLKVIGVTGTDGKTTTTHLIHHILSTTGKKVAMISTLSAKIGNNEIDTGLHVTTPDPFKIQSLLRKIVNAGTEYVVLEVTSHGLAQERVAFVNFYAGLITNITHEHLDYHKNMNRYIKAKEKLLHDVKIRILNNDDTNFDKIKNSGKGQLVTFGLKSGADIQAEKIKILPQGLSFIIKYKDKRVIGKININSNLKGEFNVYNILAAFSMAVELDIPPEEISSAVNTFSKIEGRMQYIDLGQDFDCIVDFAHTPNALQNALKTIKSTTKGRLICVFGSAGERDTAKRSMMAKVAVENANLSIFTSEDPRNEDINKILSQMERGAQNAGGVNEINYWKIPDRKTAIEKAIKDFAKKNDTVVLFGKGHEKSMNIGGIEYPWSDEKAAKEALKERLQSS